MRTVWSPMLKGKFDRYFDSVSMAWLWARIHVRANSRGGAVGQERLGYIRGGVAELTRRLESELTRAGVRILRGTVVERIESAPHRRARLPRGGAVPFRCRPFPGPLHTPLNT